MNFVEEINHQKWQQRNTEKFNSLTKPQKQNQQYVNSLADKTLAKYSLI